MVPYQNPTIFLGNIRIDEPITVLTDLLVVSICFFSFIKTKSENQTTAIKLYRWFILTTGISTLISAIIGHAFLYSFGFNAKIFGWITGIGCIVFAQFAALYHSKKIIGEKKFRLLCWLNTAEITLAFILLFVVYSFLIVEIHSAIGLILTVVVLEFIVYKQTKSALSKGFIMAIGIAVLAILCHIFKLAISVWFNHMDLSHVIIAISIYIMYTGILAEIKQTTLNTTTK